MRASFTQKMLETGEPAVLRALLPRVTLAMLHDRKLRSHTRGCVPTSGARVKSGEKAFSVWGPRVLNAIARDAIYDECPDGPAEVAEEEEP